MSQLSQRKINNALKVLAELLANQDVLQYLESSRPDSKGLSDYQEHLVALKALFEQLKEQQLIKEQQSCDSEKVIEEFPISSYLQKDLQAIALYSDGACRGNPGPGAWGCLAQNAEGVILFEAAAAHDQTTNNRMEIQGAIEGLRRVGDDFADKYAHHTDWPCLYFYCDSRYVVDGIEKWLTGWKARGWKKADKKAPENLELWQQLDQQVNRFPKLKCLWVKGHSGHPQNERCDQLANQVLDQWLAGEILEGEVLES